MPTETNNFKKGTSNFTLTGKLRTGPNTFSLDKKSENNFISNKAYLGVDCGNGNVVFAELWGGYKVDDDDNVLTKLYVHGAKVDPNNPRRSVDDFDNRFEVFWDERENEEVVNDVGPSCFIRVGLEIDKNKKLVVHKYLSPYDAVAYIEEVVSGWSDEKKDSTVVEIRGTIDYNYYEGKVSYRKTITSVMLRTDKEEKDFGAKFIQTIYVDKNSIGKADMEKCILPLYAKVPEYINKYKDIEVKETVPLNFEFQIDAKSKIAKSLANLIAKSKNYACFVVKGEFVESGTTEELDLSTLPDDVKNYLEQGLISEEDVLKAVASGNQRSYIMSINGVHVVTDEKKVPQMAYTDNVFTEKDFNSFGDKFYTIAQEADNGEDSEEVSADELPDPIGDDDEPPFNTKSDDSEPVDDMSWMANFQ